MTLPFGIFAATATDTLNGIGRRSGNAEGIEMKKMTARDVDRSAETMSDQYHSKDVLFREESLGAADARVLELNCAVVEIGTGVAGKDFI